MVASYTIKLAGDAERYYSRLPHNLQERIDEALEQIAHDPFQAGNKSKPLRGNLKGFFSARIDGYRIVYEVHE